MLGTITKLLRLAHKFGRFTATLLAATMVIASAGYMGEKIFGSATQPAASGPGEEISFDTPSARSPASAGGGAIARPAPPFPANRRVSDGSLPPSANSSRDDSPIGTSAGPQQSESFDGASANPPPGRRSALATIDNRASTATSTHAETSTATDGSGTFAGFGCCGNLDSTDTSSATATSTTTTSTQVTSYWDQATWDNDTWW